MIQNGYFVSVLYAAKIKRAHLLCQCIALREQLMLVDKALLVLSFYSIKVIAAYEISYLALITRKNYRRDCLFVVHRHVVRLQADHRPGVRDR